MLNRIINYLFGNQTHHTAGMIEEVAESYDAFNGRVVLLENKGLPNNIQKRFLVYQERKEKFFGHPDYLTIEEAGQQTNTVLNDTIF